MVAFREFPDRHATCPLVPARDNSRQPDVPAAPDAADEVERPRAPEDGREEEQSEGPASFSLEIGSSRRSLQASCCLGRLLL